LDRRKRVAAMTDKSLSHKFFTVGKKDADRWLAISTRAPYFCFEGDSAEEVRAIAGRALDFYFGVNGGRVTAGRPVRRRTRALSTFSPDHRVELPDCADA
jgi:hypothetical protein